MDLPVTCSVPHVHAWEVVAHVDACHSFTTTYACGCGASRAVGSERDLVFDPYSALHLDDACDRCRELQAGAKPASWDETRPA